MKRMFIFALGLLFTASSILAANFQPTLLKLNAPSKIKYNFDGKSLTIPVTVTGTPAGAIFLVFTKDKAAKISKTRNGFLGWHYVNKIDTCLYFSGVNSLAVGSNTITWNGKDKGGSLLGAGEYTYYLWGYDNKNAKTRVAHGWYPYYNTDVVTMGAGGKALTNPVIYRPTSRWTIGSNPADSSLFETTRLTLPTGWTQIFRTCFHPGDLNYFYAEAHNSTTRSEGVYKYQWVPGGNAVMQTTFGDNGGFFFSQPVYNGSGVSTDGTFLYAGYYGQYADGINNKLFKIDFDGALQNTFDLTEWMYHADDYKAGAQSAGGPTYMPERNGYLYFNHYGSCIKAMVNPSAENKADLFVWVNQNGDYINDHNDKPDSPRPWVCFDFNTGPYNYTISADANLFSITPSYDMGAVSIALMAPDGTGVSYLSYAGETAGWKYGDIFVDSGSAFDGIYCDNAGSAGVNYTGDKTNAFGIWYLAHDSMKGTIGTEVGVEESAPSAFVVAQNTPNPFNPSTTINFTLTKAAKTTVEVFNSSGQRVATLVNSSISAGPHSTVWNATGFSAGVYFYTVKSGDFSRTMKMTLLK
ncbi:MAG: T9SS type A sorting domain-containing protein [Candidatus Latescibacter sp.]|nr:T9SS type A sorting domain-containing protein [Candidatus Latescibacter sp.]